MTPSLVGYQEHITWLGEEIITPGPYAARFEADAAMAQLPELLDRGDR